MVTHTFYLQNVLPRIAPERLQTFALRYPHIRLEPGAHTRSAASWPVLMLVALTGTGKSTTLDALSTLRTAGQITYADVFPTRREIADLIAIPTAQVLQGAPVEPIYDRVERFHWTRTFASAVPGGLAAAFAWLHLNGDPKVPTISEGIRGKNEIAFALEHCPGWVIVELAVEPVVRLIRLTQRNDSFDHANATSDLTFLPVGLHQQVAKALEAGAISPEALAIVRAEAKNYGLHPAGVSHPRYVCLHNDDQSPRSVALQIADLLHKAVCHA